MKAFQHLGQFREDCQFSTWLIRITVNQSLMKLRKQRGGKEVSLDDDFQSNGDILPIEVTDWAPNPEQYIGVGVTGHPNQNSRRIASDPAAGLCLARY